MTGQASNTEPPTAEKAPIGLLYQMWETPRVSTTELIERALEEFSFADSLGYDSVWVGEHHYVPDATRAFYGRIPNPELLVAKAAALTQHIRVGTGVKVLNNQAATRSAEEMCMLDILTGGRADIGIGQGSSPDVDPEARGLRQQIFRDLLDDVIRLLTGDTSTGLPLLNVGPAPHVVDLMWAAVRDDASVEFVANSGLNFVVGQAEHAGAQAGYVARYRAAGGTGSARGVRAVYIADSKEQALSEFEEAFTSYYSVMAGGTNSKYVNDAIAAGHLPEKATSLEDMLQRASLIVGGPDEVAAQLSDYVQVTGVDRLDLLVQFPRLDGAHTRRTLELFDAEVRPKLQGVLALA